MTTESPLSFRLGLLLCDHVMPDLQPQFGDYPEMFQNLFGEVVPDLHYKVYDLTAMEFPASLQECDAWLFTGSKWSVYEDEPWIHRARELALRLHQEEKPLIGICFGHQLIAEALGGKVAKSESGWGVGVHKAQILQEQTWMMPGLEELKLLVSHQDQVVKLPAGAQRLAGHEFCPNDILQIGNTTLTFQGHPEFTSGYSKALMEKRQQILGEKVFSTGMQSLQSEPDKLEAAEWILTFLISALFPTP